MLPMAIKQALALYVGQCFDFPTHALPQPYTAVGMPTMANEQSTYLDVFEQPNLIIIFENRRDDGLFSWWCLKRTWLSL